MFVILGMPDSVLASAAIAGRSSICRGRSLLKPQDRNGISDDYLQPGQLSDALSAPKSVCISYASRISNPHLAPCCANILDRRPKLARL